MSPGLVIVIVLVFAGGVSGSDGDNLIDLTNVPVSTRRFVPSSSMIRGIESTATDQITPSGPLRLTLVRADVGADKNVVYEVKLTNNGSHSECIPMEPVMSEIEPKTPAAYSYTGATLWLSASGSAASEPLQSVTLFDDDGHHHCTLLSPGKALIIRAKTELQGARAATPLAGEVVIHALWSTFVAHVSLLEGKFSEKFSSANAIRSVNALQVCTTDCNH